jgi:hypothetical protein
MTKVTGFRCLSCTEKLETALVITVDKLDIRIKPKTGDVVICICGHRMVFDARMQLKDLTYAQDLALAADPRFNNRK